MEINGMNFEIEKTLKQTYKFKVGDKVKILKKSYSNYEIYYGMIVGFDDFDNNFVVTLAYLEDGYSKCELKIEYLTKDSDIKLLPYNEELDFRKEYVINKFDKMIEEKEKEIEKIKYEKEFFVKQFGKYIKEENNE